MAWIPKHLYNTCYDLERNVTSYNGFVTIYYYYKASAVSWIASGDIDVCRTKLRLYRQGTPACNLTCRWYTVNSDTYYTPNVLQGESEPVPASDLLTAPNDSMVPFEFSTPVSLSNGTRYSCVLWADAYTDVTGTFVAHRCLHTGTSEKATVYRQPTDTWEPINQSGAVATLTAQIYVSSE